MERIPDVSQRVAEPGEVSVETDPHGRVTLRRRRLGAVRGRVAGWFGASPDFTVRLDALGTAAWGLMDGVRTVGEIKAELARRFPSEPDIAARLGKFLGVLVSHQMVRLR